MSTPASSQKKLDERNAARASASAAFAALREQCETLPVHAQKFFWRELADLVRERLPLSAVMRRADAAAQAEPIAVHAARKWLAHYDAFVRDKQLGDEPGIAELREAVRRADRAAQDRKKAEGRA